MKSNPVKTRLSKHGRYDFEFTITSASKIGPAVLEESKLGKLLLIYDATGIRFGKVIFQELKDKNKYTVYGSFSANDMDAVEIKELFHNFLNDLSQHYTVSKSSYNKEKKQ